MTVQSKAEADNRSGEPENVTDEAVIADSVTDERWQAILTNDASYDSRFIYAVSTTHIFCRPSCKSRPPKKHHVRIFQSGEQALSAGYRPCKRCKPTGERLPDDEWTAVVTEYIDRNYADRLTLDVLASMCHGSPYHLQRTFKKVSGLSPAEYIQLKRVEAAKDQLIHSDKPVTEIGMSVGLPNTPYFITLFKKMTGQTPAAFRLLAQTNSEEGSKQ